MYKKSNSFVYKFVVNCQVFEITPSEDNMGQTVIVPRYKFTKNISRSHKKAFYGTLSRIIPMLLYPDLDLLKLFLIKTD